jgi:hypothetical protein
MNRQNRYRLVLLVFINIIIHELVRTFLLHQLLAATSPD